MEDSLKNKKVIIIGGSSGIGLAVAKLIAAEGANTIIASRTKERLEKAVAEIEDIAPAYLDIIRSTYITGTNIPINGGALLQTIE